MRGFEDTARFPKTLNPSPSVAARRLIARAASPRRRLEDTVTDERVGLFTPDKDGDTHTSCGRVAVIAARRGTVCGEVGRVLRFPQLTVPSTSL